MAGIFRTTNVAFLRKSLVSFGSRRSLQLHRTSRCQVSESKLPGAVEGVHHPSDFDKKVLVWTKRYPTVEDVPSTVTHSTIKKARDLFRVRVNIGMIVGAVLGCILMVYTGRRARDEGQNIGERRRKWEKQMREQGLKEEAERKAKLAQAEHAE